MLAQYYEQNIKAETRNVVEAAEVNEIMELRAQHYERLHAQLANEIEATHANNIASLRAEFLEEQAVHRRSETAREFSSREAVRVSDYKRDADALRAEMLADAYNARLYTADTQSRAILDAMSPAEILKSSGVNFSVPQSDPSFQMVWSSLYRVVHARDNGPQLFADEIERQFTYEKLFVTSSPYGACGELFGGNIDYAGMLQRLPTSIEDKTVAICAASLVRAEYARLFFDMPATVASGANGAVAIVNVATPTGTLDNFATMKIPLSTSTNGNRDSYHEAYIGMSVINGFRRNVPNFMLTYGAFECAMPLYDRDAVVTWCAATADSTTLYTVNEYIAPPAAPQTNIRGKDVRTAIKEGSLSPGGWCGILAQVVCAIDHAHLEADFTHHDLHSGNVMLRGTDETRVVYAVRETARSPTATRHASVATNGVHAIIIDFGQVRCMSPIGPVGAQLSAGSTGVERSLSNIMIDIYKFVAFSVMDFYKSGMANPSEMANMLELLRNWFVSYEITGQVLVDQFRARHFHAFPWTPQSQHFKIFEYLEHIQFIAAALGSPGIVEVGATASAYHYRPPQAAQSGMPINDAAVYASALNIAAADSGMTKEYFAHIYGPPDIGAMRGPAIAYLTRIVDDVKRLTNADSVGVNRAVKIADRLLNFALLHRAASDIDDTFILPDFRSLWDSEEPFKILHSARAAALYDTSRRGRVFNNLYVQLRSKPATNVIPPTVPAKRAPVPRPVRAPARLGVGPLL